MTLDLFDLCVGRSIAVLFRGKADLQVVLFGRPSKHKDSDYPQLVNVTEILKSVLSSPKGQQWVSEVSAVQPPGVRFC